MLTSMPKSQSQSQLHSLVKSLMRKEWNRVKDGEKLGEDS